MARMPTRQAPSKIAASDAKPAFHLTADQLVARGIVAAEKRDDLRRYLAALKALDDLFRHDGRRPSPSADLRREFGEALRRTLQAARDLNDESRSLLEWLASNAMVHVEELLKGAPDRLERLRGLYTGAQRAVEVSAGVVEDMTERLGSIERSAAASRDLLDALADLRRALSE